MKASRYFVLNIEEEVQRGARYLVVERTIRGNIFKVTGFFFAKNAIDFAKSGNTDCSDDEEAPGAWDDMPF